MCNYYSLAGRTRLRRRARHVIAGLLFLASGAHAAAPLVGTQAPGFYRMMLGAFEITALSDGVFDLDTRKLLTNAPPAVVSDLLTGAFHPAELPTSVNAYLVNTGERLILIDAGAAGLFGPTLGHLLENLLASGYRPDQVDAILITHMHPDHIGGLTAAGKRVFSNATVYASQRESGYWLGVGAVEAAPVAARSFFEQARDCINPYVAAGRFKSFGEASELLPGVRAQPAPGHTPGHTLYAIESRGQKLVIWGDLTEIASVQFLAPSVTIAYDSDEDRVVVERRKAYAEATREGFLVAGSHLPFPGIGHVRMDREGYTWLPIDYNTIH